MPSVLEEKDAIRELLARYCFHFDNGEFEEWLDCFTEDATFDVVTLGRFSGRDALRMFLQLVPLTNGLPMMKHCVMNSIVRVDGGRASAQSYVLVVAHAGEILGLNVAGRYDDQLTKRGGTWRFTERRAHLDLMSGR